MLQGFCTAAHTVRTPPPQATRRCFTEEQIGAVMAGTLEGLIYLHRLNKIHRDIKAGPHAERTRLGGTAARPAAWGGSRTHGR